MTVSDSFAQTKFIEPCLDFDPTTQQTCSEHFTIYILLIVYFVEVGLTDYNYNNHLDNTVRNIITEILSMASKIDIKIVICVVNLDHTYSKFVSLPPLPKLNLFVDHTSK